MPVSALLWQRAWRPPQGLLCLANIVAEGQRGFSVPSWFPLFGPLAYWPSPIKTLLLRSIKKEEENTQRAREINESGERKVARSKRSLFPVLCSESYSVAMLGFPTKNPSLLCFVWFNLHFCCEFPFICIILAYLCIWVRWSSINIDHKVWLYDYTSMVSWIICCWYVYDSMHYMYMCLTPGLLTYDYFVEYTYMGLAC